MQAKKEASCDAISLVEDAVPFTVYQWIKDKASLDQNSHVLFLNYSKSDRDTEFPSAAENKVKKSTLDKNWAETWVELYRAAEKQPNIHSLFVPVSLCTERCIWVSGCSVFQLAHHLIAAYMFYLWFGAQEWKIC